MSQDTALLPCPFCGNVGTSDPRHKFNVEQVPECVSVCCGQCGARGPWERHYGEASEAEAEAAWNRRAALEGAQADPWRMAVDAAMVDAMLDCTTPDSDPVACVKFDLAPEKRTP